MSDGITDTTKHEHELIEEWQRQTIDNFLKDLSKEELVNELCKREGVKEIVVDPYIQYSITTYTQQDPYTFLRSLQAYGGSGAARILVVTE